MKPDVRICADVNELSVRAAETAVRTIDDAVRHHGRCSLVLSGGSTPRTLYGLLASEFRHQIPWTRVHVFWGDERYVLADDPDSNCRMAKEALLDHVPCPAENIHPMPTHFSSPDAAARDYELTLRSYFGTEPPRFDLILLGLGEEGHTASLFPGSPALAERTRWVVAVTTRAKPPLRLTLTLPVLTRAANIEVLVVGSTKARALHHALTGIPDPNTYPAAGLRFTEGSVIWWVDREAAAQQTRDTPAPHTGGIKALAFDAYGTLFDVFSVTSLCDELFPGHGHALAQSWRGKQLQYSLLRSTMGRHKDFWGITEDSLVYAANVLKLGLTADKRKRLMDAYLVLTAFPDVKPGLEALKKKGLRLAILSNGEPKMLQAAAQSAGISGSLDAIISVEDVMTFKPAPQVYKLVATRLNVAAMEAGFVSSNNWDINGAGSAGLQTFWVRRGAAEPQEELGFPAHHIVQALTDLPALLAP